GVPSDQFVTRIGVNRAERPSGGGDLAFVMHRVTSQGGVIGLEVQLEVLEQPVFAEEVQACRRIKIVLVFGRFFWFWLDVEGACETDLLLVVDRHVQEPREVIDLSLEVRVPETCISLAATPEGITRPPELVRYLKRLLYLRGGVDKDIGIWAGRRAVAKPRVCKETSGSPEEFDCRALLFFLEDLHDRIEVLVRFREACSFRCDIAIVKRVEGSAEFLDEFEGDASPIASVLNGV